MMSIDDRPTMAAPDDDPHPWWRHQGNCRYALQA
jgi:hypothetical protein